MTEPELLELESQLLTAETRGSQEKLKELLSDDFVEFTSSGTIIDKSAAIASAVTADVDPRYVMSDFRMRTLSDAVVQALFETEHTRKNGERVKALRSSLWRKEGEVWRVVFYQGTVKK